ncbi:nitrate reductase cytochrome c-type subunit [Dyella solisilvae]|uniref:Periplasmic nitrate reductase, electron transfer subunit n=1 Tax=Dyella solisilvae TaxID=1920168 RepID=A0A370K6M4_9GAMM|nr:nitrate reductase cytochrome c-type subunit [Dyella solisilvae]RDI98107.1 nitrate reductase cytochrome c-type subunit [Dyella solisilvae]
MRDKPVVAIALLAIVVAVAVGYAVGRKSAPASSAVSEPVAAAQKPTAPASATEARPASNQIDAIRRGVPIAEEASPPVMAHVENTDIKRVRAYPMQPPTIPHSIDNYQIDKNSNRCLLCHARANADRFQAPPVSVTHYMDRDEQILATISPRRYFCTQCHVTQTDAKPLVANNFKDIDTVMSEQPVQKAN